MRARAKLCTHPLAYQLAHTPTRPPTRARTHPSARLRYCEEPLAAGVQRPWCAGRLPNLYGFVQERYWGVGLFKYFTITQVRACAHIGSMGWPGWSV